MAIRFLDEQQPAKKSKIRFLDEKGERPRTAREYISPSWLTKYKEKPGERTLWGDIGERPQKAIGAGIMSKVLGGKFWEGYKKGALRPEETPSFREVGEKVGRITEQLVPETKGLIQKPLETAGAGADITTDPSAWLAMLLGTRYGKGAMKGAIKPAKATWNMFKKAIRFAKGKTPKIMGDKWIYAEAKRGQTVTKGIQNALGQAYDDIYGRVKDYAVDPAKMDDILLRTSWQYVDDAGNAVNMRDVVLREIDEIVGGRIDTVGKAKVVVDILRRRTPKSYYLAGGKIGKGGLTSPQIRQMNTIRAIKDVMDDAVSVVDKETGIALKNLNKFAHDKVYPTLEKMRSIFGKAEIGKTEEIATVYKGALGKAAQRLTIKATKSQIMKEFRRYIPASYKNDLRLLAQNASQLVKNMNKFKARQSLRWLSKTGVKAGVAYGGYRLLKGAFGGSGGGYGD